MKRKINISCYHLILLLAAWSFGSCKKDYTDPGSATSDKVLSSVSGLTGVAIGLQNWYTNDRGGLVYNTVTASGLVTGEIYVVNAGNTDEQQLFQGGDALQNTNGVVTGMWTVANKIIYDADNVINNTPKVVSDKGYASGLIAYASIFKALSLADMSMFWDHVPDTTGTNVSFIANTDGLNKAIAVIDNALATINANPVSSGFINSIPPGIDITNTLYALKARFSLFAGNYPDALTAAGNVNLASTSVFSFNSVTLNPIFLTATSTNNIFQPVDSTMGLPASLAPDLNDKRVPFYIATSANPRFRLSGFYAGSTQSIPIYLPGEILLIKAEAYTQANDLVNGLDQLNKVVTKQPSDDPFGVGAGLAPYASLSQSDLLLQIYRNRSIELFLSGLRLEDMRRFQRPQTELKRSYFPYPFVERNDNKNTPNDPSF